MEMADFFAIFLLHQMDSSTQAEMQYGQKTTRWQESLSTDKGGRGGGGGGGRGEEKGEEGRKKRWQQAL